MAYMVAPATAADSADWLRLRLALYRPDNPEDAGELSDEIAAMIAGNGTQCGWLARSDDGAAIGLVEASIRHDYVNGALTSPVAFLEGIYVDPAFRRQGIARQLTAAVAAWARAHNLSELASDALLENSASHAMHAALGFTETDRVVFFRKDLTQLDER